MASATSNNWAGYATSGGSQTSASTTFVIPTIKTCQANESSWAAFWAGLDGWGNNTVEQSGVDLNCNNGVRSYIPWYEVYPTAPVEISGMTVNPGDTMVATDSYVSGTTYTLTLTDQTTSVTKTYNETAAGGTNYSAECIAEDQSGAPSESSYGSYTNYGSVTFSSCTTNGQPIGLSTSNPTLINTTNVNGTTATASSLT
jgi:hypothetical protein